MRQCHQVLRRAHRAARGRRPAPDRPTRPPSRGAGHAPPGRRPGRPASSRRSTRARRRTSCPRRTPRPAGRSPRPRSSACRRPSGWRKRGGSRRDRNASPCVYIRCAMRILPDGAQRSAVEGPVGADRRREDRVLHLALELTRDGGVIVLRGVLEEVVFVGMNADAQVVAADELLAEFRGQGGDGERAGAAGAPVADGSVATVRGPPRRDASNATSPTPSTSTAAAATAASTTLRRQKDEGRPANHDVRRRLARLPGGLRAMSSSTRRRSSGGAVSLAPGALHRCFSGGSSNLVRSGVMSGFYSLLHRRVQSTRINPPTPSAIPKSWVPYIADHALADGVVP